MTATDVFGNTKESIWTWQLISDQPPVAEIESPAPGTRLREGEQFLLAAFVNDDRKVISAEFFVEDKVGSRIVAVGEDATDLRTVVAYRACHPVVTNRVIRAASRSGTKRDPDPDRSAKGSTP